MPTKRAGAFFHAERKDAIRARDEMTALKKACEKARDIDGARFFRDGIAFQLARYRAVTFVLPWFDAAPPGDCTGVIAPSLWPTGLADALDRLIRRMWDLPRQNPQGADAI